MGALHPARRINLVGSAKNTDRIQTKYRRLTDIGFSLKQRLNRQKRQSVMTQQRTLRLRIAHSVDHQLNVFGICIRRNPVTQIKNMRPAPKGINDRAGFLHQCIAPCDHVRGL